jgi:hypothetical protein
VPRKQTGSGKRAPRKQAARNSARSGNPANRAAAGGRPAARPTPGRSLPQGGSFFTPNASPTRQRIEQASAPVLVLLHRLPRVVMGAVPLALLVLGAFLPVPIALVALALALLLLVWLAYLSWPQAEGGQRALRLVVPGLVVAIVVLRLTRG